MALSIARFAVAAMASYAGLGVLFASWFVSAGVARVDHEARTGSFGFRVLIFPACVALWPLLLWRSMRANGAAPTECNAHRNAAREVQP